MYFVSKVSYVNFGVVACVIEQQNSKGQVKDIHIYRAIDTLGVNGYMLRVSLSRSLKAMDQAIQLVQLLLGNLHQLRILLNTLHRRRARNRDHKRQVRIRVQAQHPVDGDLAGGAALFAGNLLNLLDESEVVLELGWLEAGEGGDCAELFDVVQSLVLASEELRLMLCQSSHFVSWVQVEPLTPFPRGEYAMMGMLCSFSAAAMPFFKMSGVNMLSSISAPAMSATLAAS